jgi:spermidine synthase
LASAGEDVLYEGRSFFGVYKITGEEEGAGYHTLSHGDTNHGAQILGVTPPEPITYYHRTGPIGQLFDALPNQDVKSRVALIGLGTGTMACYNSPGQQWTFYEIDPLIESIARNPNLFTYLRDCPGETNVILGDARLKLSEAPAGEYGMIVADAFSSDAIPVHLMTREAIDMYFQKLRSDGVLAIHISNRHLDLEPVLGDLARDRGLTCYSEFDATTDGIPGKFASHWVVMARKPADLGSVPDDERWQTCATKGGDVWTDDFSNLLSTLEWD